MGRLAYVLLIFIPLSIYCRYYNYETAMFFTSCMAIVPLAGIMGRATESLASYTGERMGGFINATFGNATELLITVFALQAALYDVVKASIAGSIMGNILLVLGLSILAGGLRNGEQQFDRVHVTNQTSLMLLAVIALIIPAVFFASAGQAQELGNFSLVVAGILLLLYLSGLVFAIKRTGGEKELKDGRWSLRVSVAVLALSTVLIALESELLVAGIEPVTRVLGWSNFFIGIVIIPIIGNAAEHFTAVLMAWKNKIDLAFEIAVGSSTQMAMLITPLLVFLGLALNRPMSLMFNYHEIVAVALSVLIAQFVSLDGESNWLEGSLLVGAYAIMAIAFFFI